MNYLLSFKRIAFSVFLLLPILSHAQQWRIVEEVYQANNVNGWETADSTSYQYAASTNRGSTYRNDTIDFDESFNTRFMPNNNIQQRKYLRVYNNAEQVVAHTEQGYDAGTSSWVVNSIDSTIYDANGKVKSEIYYTEQLISGQKQMILDEQVDYTYDANGRLVMEELSTFNGVGMPLRKVERQFYQYNANGQVVLDSMQRALGANWKDYEITETSYDANGNITLMLVYNFTTTKNLRESKYYYYNMQGQLVKDSVMFNTGSGGQSETHTYHYNSKGLLVADTGLISGMGMATLIMYDYTTFDYLSKEQYATIDLSSFNIDYVGEITYKYQSYIPVSINEVAHNTADGLTLYPNPATNVLHIDSKADFDAAYIYNTAGQMVQQLRPNTTQVNISQLPVGNYVLQLSTDGKMLTKQFVVVR